MTDHQQTVSLEVAHPLLGYSWEEHYLEVCGWVEGLVLCTW